MGRLVSLDERAAEYILSLEKRTGHKVKWFDMYLEQPHLKENWRYHKYKISVRVGKVDYGIATKNVEKPGYVFSQWYHNESSEPVKSTFSKSTEFESTFSWANTVSMKVGISATLSLGVPAVFGGSSTISAEMGIESTATDTETKKDSYSISNEVLVEPQRSAKATFTVSERDMSVPYEADIFISGWIAIWFDEKYDGHWLWFYRIDCLANEDFQRVGNGELSFIEKGEFKGVRGMDSTFRVQEFPLQMGDTDVPVGRSRLITDIRIPDEKFAAFRVAAELLE